MHARTRTHISENFSAPISTKIATRKRDDERKKIIKYSHIFDKSNGVVFDMFYPLGEIIFDFVFVILRLDANQIESSLIAMTHPLCEKSKL